MRHPVLWPEQECDSWLFDWEADFIELPEPQSVSLSNKSHLGVLVCMCGGLCVYIYMNVCVYACVCMHVCACVCMYIHIVSTVLLENPE